MLRLTFALLALLGATTATAKPKTSGPSAVKLEAQAFLDSYNSLYVGLSTVAGEAEWAAKTDVGELTDARRVAAGQMYASFKGDREIIRHARALLERRSELDPLQARQLDFVLLRAATSPGTIPAVVNELVAAEGRQSMVMDGFTFCLGPRAASGSCPKPVSANDIDARLRDAKDPAERLAVFAASKAIGVPLKSGLQDLQRLRNQVAREMGHSSYFALQVAEYGMTVPEMMKLLDGILADTRPLYDALHTWSRRELATRYGQPMPTGPTPAHWFTNRWSQNWGGLVPAVDLAPYFKGRTKEWIVQQAESFYVSLGMPKLPPSFWEKSDLYALPADATRKKNAHASAWHINAERDVRSLMSIEVDPDWFGTAHHELGHIYYYLAYSRPEVPPILREGANRAFHEAVGDLIYIAASQEPYLRQQKILPPDVKIDPTALLLNEALDQIPFLPWSAGVMSHFEHDLYEKNLPAERWQEAWWAAVKQYQDIAPPTPDRLNSKELCDACTKTHINDDPAQYYDYALAAVIKYQLHEHIATKILKQDPHSCNYYGSAEVGAFLSKILALGATRDWREVLKEATGEPISTRAMLAYFAPLKGWLEEQNALAARKSPAAPKTR